MELLLQGVELRAQHLHVVVHPPDVLLYALDVSLALADLRVDGLKVLQPLPHVCLVLAQCLFLFLDFLLYLGALLLQSLDGCVGILFLLFLLFLLRAAFFARALLLWRGLGLAGGLLFLLCGLLRLRRARAPALLVGLGG